MADVAQAAGDDVIPFALTTARAALSQALKPAERAEPAYRGGMAGEQHKQQDRRHPHPPEPVDPQTAHEQLACPVCGRPVATVIRRRKALGIFIPEWVPGPCRNPDCAEYVPEVGKLP
ncbi:hypothetical protein ACIA98_06585 [Streptomyces sp. NPDC051366]|uniref:hypothetical protein n=1 Tax=Streptomyces sp. NPDC051366 TaxID=3365652 RepID=UPI0037B4FD1D